MLMQILRDFGDMKTLKTQFYRGRTGSVVNFSNFSLLWVSKLQTEIALSTLHSEYVSLYHSIRSLIPLKIIIKEVIETWKFIARS